MISMEEINVRKMIMHVVDSSLSMPLMSKEELQSSYETKDFFASHIAKVMNDDSGRNCKWTTTLSEKTNMFLMAVEKYSKTNDFIGFSEEIAHKFFGIMSMFMEIKNGDLAIVEYNCMTMPHIAILKMNYKSVFNHHYDQTVKRLNLNELRTGIPAPSQKIDEAIIVNLKTLETRVIEKKYTLDGESGYYISPMILTCEAEMSSKMQLKNFTGIVNNINKKFFEHDPEVALNNNKEIYESIDDYGSVDIEEYADRCFKSDELKEVFIDKLEKRGITEKIQIEEKTLEREFTKKSIKTDLGIEFKIPMHHYMDPSMMEIIVQDDGKLSFVFKGISKVI